MFVLLLYRDILEINHEIIFMHFHQYSSHLSTMARSMHMDVLFRHGSPHYNMFQDVVTSIHVRILSQDLIVIHIAQ